MMGMKLFGGTKGHKFEVFSARNANFTKVVKMLSQATTFTIALFALDLNDFVGNSLIGIHAKGNFVHQFELAMQLLQSQMIIS